MEKGGLAFIRDTEGRRINAYVLPLGQGTSNCAEEDALEFGINWCLEETFSTL